MIGRARQIKSRRLCVAASGAIERSRLHSLLSRRVLQLFLVAIRHWRANHNILNCMGNYHSPFKQYGGLAERSCTHKVNMEINRREHRSVPGFPNGNSRTPVETTRKVEQEASQRLGNVSQEDFERMKTAEKEDDFFAIRKATDITKTDTKGDPCPPLPIKLIQGSFRHILGVREACSKNGTFLQRSIELRRKPGESLGFFIRQGDGWERMEGIFVSRIVLGTDVDIFELLRVGDEIIKVNKVDVRGMSIQDVSALMQMTRRLILTVKVLTPLNATKYKLALKDGGKSSNARATRSESLPGRTTSLLPEDRRLSTTSRLSHQSDYKVANLVIGKSRDAMNATAMTSPSGGSSSGHRGSRRSSKSPVLARRALSPIRETAPVDAAYNSDPEGRGSSSRRPSRAASVVSWSDQYYGPDGMTSPVKHKPGDRRKSETAKMRPK